LKQRFSVTVCLDRKRQLFERGGIIGLSERNDEGRAEGNAVEGKEAGKKDGKEKARRRQVARPAVRIDLFVVLIVLVAAVGGGYLHPAHISRRTISPGRLT